MGGKGLGKHWLGRKCCLFRFSFVLGPAKEFKLKTSRVSSPAHKKHFAWCHVRGNVRDVWGKRVGETLAWEEVLSFYIQFVLGSAKEFKTQNLNSSEPHPQKTLCMVPC